MIEIDPNIQWLNAIKAEVARNEIKLGGKPYAGQLLREGHYPKYSAMIDELEDLAVEYIAERKYLDLLKKFSNENNTELIEMLEANRNAVSNFSEEKGSEEKR